MGLRGTIGSTLELIIGHDRTNKIRKAERRARNALAKRLVMSPPKTKPKPKPSSEPIARPSAPRLADPAEPPPWQPRDPLVPHPKPRMSRHQLLRGLHERTRPRTYLEIGINDGSSLALSTHHVRSALDPTFNVTKPDPLRRPPRKSTPSDDFFAGDDPVRPFPRRTRSTSPSSMGCTCPNSRCATSSTLEPLMADPPGVHCA